MSLTIFFLIQLLTASLKLKQGLRISTIPTIKPTLHPRRKRRRKKEKKEATKAKAARKSLTI
ncbi:MAG: hypothetical protein QME28_09390 [Candidatus Saccharicenans sp.]|nr:hypothetical protein [Candidatus Saccharicenans sp.]